MITRLALKKFRIFEDVAIELGQMVTAIAGHNATGKSTLLGIIGNSCELKASQGKTVTSNQFRTEFSELFKGSPKYDVTGQIGTLTLKNSGRETEINLRVAWQKNNTRNGVADRFRIIPKWTRSSGTTEGKYPLPSLYLGLSRLYPLGEVPSNEVKKKRRIGTMSDTDRTWLYDTYNRILTLTAPIESVSNYRINKKVSGGINTCKYDYLTNSSGQDNLMQILYALLSFRLLRQKMKAQWKGGVLLIDEIDATLHPVAQIRLLDVILEVCDEVGLQVVFTTHSLQLLEYLTENHSPRDKHNKIVVNYLTTANNDLEVHINPDQEFIINDMMIESSIQQQKKVIVYSEDAEARWFLGKILSSQKRYVKIVDMNFGCEQAKTWIKTDPEYFKNILFVLDGDASVGMSGKTNSRKAAKVKPQAEYKNVIFLPGAVPPEMVIYNYLIGLPGGHEYLHKNSKRGVSIRYFSENGPDSSKYNKIKEPRDRNKRWFNDNKKLFEESDLFRYWARDNEDLIRKFLGQFKHCHDIIADHTGAERFPAVKKAGN